VSQECTTLLSIYGKCEFWKGTETSEIEHSPLAQAAELGYAPLSEKGRESGIPQNVKFGARTERLLA
jgi:hypothetical protein